MTGGERAHLNDSRRRHTLRRSHRTVVSVIAVALAGLVASAAPAVAAETTPSPTPSATATSATYITPGAFCADPGKKAQSKDGDWYICEARKGPARWYPTTPPGPTPTATPVPTPTQTPSPTATPTSPEPTVTDTTPPPDSPELPVTGNKVPALVGAALLLGAAGVAAVLVARRRKTRFTA